MLTKNLVVFFPAASEQEAIQALSIGQAISVSGVPMLISAPTVLERSLSGAVARFGGKIISADQDPLRVAARVWPGKHVLLLPACTTDVSLHGITLALELLEQQPEVTGIAGVLNTSEEWSSHALCWANYAVGTSTKIALPAETSRRNWSPAGMHSYMFVDAPGPFQLLRSSKMDNINYVGSPWLLQTTEHLISHFENDRQFLLFTGMQAIVGNNPRQSQAVMAEGDVCDLSDKSHAILEQMGVDQIVIPGVARIYFDDVNSVSFLTKETAVDVFGQPSEREIGVESFYQSALTSKIVGPLLDKISEEETEFDEKYQKKRVVRWRKRAHALVRLLIISLLISFLLLILVLR